MAEITRISRSFKDISLSFQPHPVTGDLPVLRNERAINRSVRNIVQTVPGEKFFNPNFGSQAGNQLFELVDFASADIIEQEILTALQNYEPRIESVQVKAEPFPDSNSYSITVLYDIVGQEIPSQTYTFILEATR